MKLHYIAESKTALELDGYQIAAIRIFEAYASENKLNEATAQLIFEMANIAQNLKQIDASALSLNFPFVQKGRKIRVQLPFLKKEINQYLGQQNANDILLFMGLLHGYIASQKTELKYQIFLANTLVNHWMKENNYLEWPIIPMANTIKNNLKQTDELLERGFETGDMQAWMLFFLSILRQGSLSRIQQLQQLVALKKVTREIIAKYTLYALPVDQLMSLLFEKPYIKAADIIGSMDCHRQTAYVYLDHLQRLGLLIQKKSGREKLYFHKRLFDVLLAVEINVN